MRVVVLEKPYDHWQDLRCREFFVKMVGLKLQGYLTRHIYGTLPLDTTDFIASHVLICREEAGGLNPISAFKTVTARCCGEHRLAFSAETILKSSGAVMPLHALEKILTSAENTGNDIADLGSWTICPHARENRLLSRQIKRLIAGLVRHYHRTYGINEVIACGAPRLKTTEFIQAIGFVPLIWEGVELGAFEQASLMGEPAVMMHLTEFSSWAEQMAQESAALWRERITIGESGARAIAA